MRAPVLVFWSSVWLVGLAGCVPRSRPAITPAAGGLVAFETTRIEGLASFPPQHVDEPSLEGKLINLTSQADGDRTRWSFAIEDDADQGHSYAIELPPEVVPALATGSRVTVAGEVVGAGPDAVGHLVITDHGGGLLIAIGALPAGWKAEPGPPVATTRAASATAAPAAGTAGDATRPVRVTAPDGAAVELVAAPWRAFELAGAHFVGIGAAQPGSASLEVAIVRVH